MGKAEPIEYRREIVFDPTMEEINKLWNAHEEVILYLDEHKTAIEDLVEKVNGLIYVALDTTETVNFLVEQTLKYGVNILQMKKKIPQYQLKQIVEYLEEMHGKLEYTFSKVEELKQKSTPKEEQEDYL